MKGVNENATFEILLRETLTEERFVNIRGLRDN